MATTNERSDTEGGGLGPTRGSRGNGGGGGGAGAGRALRRYGPFGAIIVIVAVIATVTLVAGGGDGGDGNGSSTEVASQEQLVRSGPMTPEKAELLGREVDFGPNCDAATGKVAIPTIYAPPCVQPFEGDNGGETSAGVTADSVKLVAYITDPANDPLLASQIAAAGADVSPESAMTTIQGYVDMYQEYFETYGRTVEVEFYTATGAYDDEAAAKADAIAIAEKGPFAVVNGPAQASRVFADELAAREILCIGRCALAIPEAFTKERVPYLWAIGPSPEEASRLAAEALGNQAPPGPAEYAGDALASEERVYGAVHYETPDGSQKEAFATFESELERNGIELETDVAYFLEINRLQENARTIVTKLKDAGVTTVIYYGDPITPGALTNEATAQDYFPEWAIGPNVLADTAVFARTFDQEQWSHAFGISLIPGRSDQETQDSYFIYEWFNGEPPPNNTYGIIAPDLAIFFRGVHLAGPDLTPEGFRDGLFRSPPAGGGPTTPHLSWGEQGVWPYPDLWGSDDAALIWWDPDAQGEDEIGREGTGLYRYANGGERYKLGEWPSKAEGNLYDDASSVTIHAERPPEDQPPDYPSPAG